MEKIEVIKLSCKMQDPNGRLIPRGVIETLSVDITDGVAVFHFMDGRTTERFAKVAIELDKQKGLDNTRWLPRVQKAVTKYEGKSKEEIKDLIVSQLKQMEGKF